MSGGWRAGRDSNPHMGGYETTILSIELPAHFHHRPLLASTSRGHFIFPPLFLNRFLIPERL
jgi:hypothetical protein